MMDFLNTKGNQAKATSAAILVDSYTERSLPNIMMRALTCVRRVTGHTE